MSSYVGTSHLGIVDTIECRVCGRKSVAEFVSVYHSDWYMVPDGWYVADTYPPGDLGLQYVCSAHCMEELKQSWEHK